MPGEPRNLTPEKRALYEADPASTTPTAVSDVVLEAHQTLDALRTLPAGRRRSSESKRAYDAVRDQVERLTKGQTFESWPEVAQQLDDLGADFRELMEP